MNSIPSSITHTSTIPIGHVASVNGQVVSATLTSPSSHVTVPLRPIGESSLTQTETNNISTIRPANNKRPLMTTTKDGKQLSEKKLRRLEKNRLSARECRRRKREATDSMQQEINILEGENFHLRLQLRIGKEAEESLGEEQIKVTKEINKLLQAGAPEVEIYSTIEMFKEKFADYGRDRRSAINFHIQNIERLLMPTQTTTVAMRALGSSTFKRSSIDASKAASMATIDKQITSSTKNTTSPDLIVSHLSDTKKLFEYLVEYLEITPEQATTLKDSRWVARDLDDSLAKSMNVLKELQNRLHQAGNGLETEFDKVRAILTPTQAAKFLVWVANNQACIHMLNELWDRIYTEPADTNEKENEITSSSLISKIKGSFS